MGKDARELSRAELNALATQIHHVVTRTGLDLALQIGGLLLTAFYDGSPSQAAEASGKPPSLRRLAEHPDISLSASTLSVYLAVRVQYDLIDVDIARKLPITSHRALLRVKDPELKRRLARRAAVNMWTTRVLKAEIEGLNLPAGPGGRPRRPRAAVLIERVAKEAERAAAAPLPELETSHEDVNALLARLDHSIEALSAVRGHLREMTLGPPALVPRGATETLNTPVEP